MLEILRLLLLGKKEELLLQLRKKDGHTAEQVFVMLN
jgi:hypothetical protein